MDTPEALAFIKADPYLGPLAMTESSFNPDAENPDSTAKGIFQFIDSTAKALGLEDPFNVPESLIAIQTLTAQNAKIIGSMDPYDLYGAHVLGPSLYNKVLEREPLDTKEQMLVNEFYSKDLPHFAGNYIKMNGDVG